MLCNNARVYMTKRLKFSYVSCLNSKKINLPFNSGMSDTFFYFIFRKICFISTSQDKIRGKKCVYRLSKTSKILALGGVCKN